MQTRWKLIALLFSVLLCSAKQTPAQETGNTQQETIRKLQARRDELRFRMDQLRIQLAEIQSELDAIHGANLPQTGAIESTPPTPPPSPQLSPQQQQEAAGKATEQHQTFSEDEEAAPRLYNAPLEPASPEGKAPPVNETSQLKVEGAVSTPLTLTLAALSSMPRTKLKVTNPHTGKTETYEGVLLEELLRRAGAPPGQQLRGQRMTTYVEAEGTDGYRVVFAMAELDSDFMSSEVLVADTLDGSPIDPKRGQLRLIAPHDKRPARWVRMLKSITVVTPKD
jgi:DMSO/TMAO reductase YedYZ molybdopterin-dependent catalytic subunit